MSIMHAVFWLLIGAANGMLLGINMALFKQSGNLAMPWLMFLNALLIGWSLYELSRIK